MLFNDTLGFIIDEQLCSKDLSHILFSTEQIDN